MGHIWSAFLQLNDSRTMGQAVPNPITYEGIKAFMDVTLTPLTPRDVEVIKKLDKIYLEVMNSG